MHISGRFTHLLVKTGALQILLEEIRILLMDPEDGFNRYLLNV